MTLEVQVVFDAGSPRALGTFWALALGYVEESPPAGFDSWDAALDAWGFAPDDRDTAYAVVDPQGAGPRVFFQRVPEGKTAKNRVHLDLHPPEGTRDEVVRKLIDLGAKKLWDGQLGPQSWVTLADPEGNELCVSDPGPST
jgi:hypothetical protein